MPKRTSDYRSGLLEELQDPTEAGLYLNAALEDSDEMFLVALRDVAEAHQLSRIAKEVDISREHLYRMLSPTGNPRYNNLLSLLRALGLRLTVQAASGTAHPDTPPPSSSTDPDHIIIIPAVTPDITAAAEHTNSEKLVMHTTEIVEIPRKPSVGVLGWLRTATATA